MTQNAVKADCKLVLLGAGGVGKSALTIRFVTGNFAVDYDPTIEDSYRKHVTVDDKGCLLEILDTAGQEEFSSMQDQWIREGNGFLLIYSIISTASFEKISTFRNKVLRNVENADEKKIPIVIAGNKCDLENQRQVETEYAKNKANEWGCGFYETSAKERIYNEEIFYQCVRMWRKMSQPNIDPDDKKKKKKGICTML